jgi:hypothetical protein
MTARHSTLKDVHSRSPQSGASVPADRKARWRKNFLLWFWYPLASSCFVAGSVIAAHFLEGPFDWRYGTLSSLSTASTNPHGYAYCCLGLMVAFTMGLPLCGYISVRFAPIAPRAAWFSSRALKVGFVGVVAVGAERLFAQSHPLHIYKAHEYLSIVTFFGLLLGIAGYWICLTRWLLHERRWPVWALSALSLVSVGPILGTGLSQAYLYFVPNDFGWVGPDWAELGVPLYLSFAFWEWLTCVGIFIYLFLILLWLPAEVPAKGAGAMGRATGRDHTPA